MSIRDFFEDAKTLRDGGKIENRLWKTLEKHFKHFSEKHPEDYEELCDCLFLDVNGMHFNENMLKKAYSGMVNDNGTLVPHFTIDEVKNGTREYGIRMNGFNIYDFAYTVNMFYSDYCNVIGDDKKMYFMMAKKFLEDKDAPDGGADKAMIYWRAMKDAEK